MSGAASPAQTASIWVSSSGPTAAPSSWTKSPRCRWSLQVELLRVLETGTFMRVGSTEARHTDVRIVAASNRNLAQAVVDGALREDLLYRLNVFPLHLPPLRVGWKICRFWRSISWTTSPRAKGAARH